MRHHAPASFPHHQTLAPLAPPARPRARQCRCTPPLAAAAAFAAFCACHFASLFSPSFTQRTRGRNSLQQCHSCSRTDAHALVVARYHCSLNCQSGIGFVKWRANLPDGVPSVSRPAATAPAAAALVVRATQRRLHAGLHVCVLAGRPAVSQPAQPRHSQVSNN